MTLAQSGNSEVRGVAMAAPRSSGAAAPATPAPVGATDCHHHIFDPRFQKDSAIPVPSITVADYRLFKCRLGLSRSVVVAPSNYGTNNACLLDALDQLGTQAARGVACVDPDVADAELDRLHQHGVRGMRIYLAKGRIPTPQELRGMDQRAQDRGWTLQFVGTHQKEVLVEWEPVLAQLRAPLVIDHFGWAPQPAGVASATAVTLFRLLGRGNVYVKLSGLYLSSLSGYPLYSDIDPLAEALVAAAPQRLIWGTDWPHAGAEDGQPDGAILFDRLAQWAPDPAVRRAILVDTPTRLYWADL